MKLDEVKGSEVKGVKTLLFCPAKKGGNAACLNAITTSFIKRKQ